MAWLLASLPLLLGKTFLPAPTLLIAVIVAVILIAWARRVPGSWPSTLSPAGADGRPASRWPAWLGLAATFLVAAGFAAWQLKLSSDNAIVVRDTGAYLQTGYWLAQHGSLPIPKSLAAFGGAHPGLSFSSTGFQASSGSIVPGVMSGLPMLLTAGFWIHGITAGQLIGPILGAFAVLTFGGLAGRLAGPGWSPVAALLLALSLPEQYTSRGSFAEIAMQVLLFGGLSLVIDAQALAKPATSEPQTAPLKRVPPARRTMVARLRQLWLRPGRRYAGQRAAIALGGLMLGLTSLVRIDGLLYLLPAIVFVGLLFARKHAGAAVAFGIGLVIGAGYGLLDGLILARPLFDSLHPLPELTGLLAACLVLLSLAGVQLLRIPGLGRVLRKIFAVRPLRWLPAAGCVLAIAVFGVLIARPYLQTVQGQSTGTVASYVASLQHMQNLPVSPGRLYSEDSLYWVYWYIGLPALLLGWFGAAILLMRGIRAALTWRDPSATARMWALPLGVIFWGSAVVLWDPSTVPDQPWASRRLVPLVLPGLILCATWAAATLRHRARARGASRTAGVLVAIFCIVALVVPNVVNIVRSGGANVTYDRTSGVQASFDGLALKQTGLGETGAVQRLCSALGPSASVIIVDKTVASEFSQTIRGMCGVPVASMDPTAVNSVQNVISAISAANRRPVLLAARAAELASYGNPSQVLNLTTSQEPHTLIQPPSSAGSAHYRVWMATPPSSGIGV